MSKTAPSSHFLRLGLMGFAALAPLASIRADVLVVDASGGGQFLQISTAVAAAANGDTLLVKSGTYSAFTIDGKGLSVAADTSAIVTIDGSIGVKNIASTQTVVLSGLRSSHLGSGSSSTDPTFGTGLFVSASQGAVRAQTCQFEGRFGTGGSCWSILAPGRSGVYLAASPNVALIGCSMRGGDGDGHGAQCWCGTNGGAGGIGLFLQDSRAAIYDCTATGGDGGRGAEVGGKGGDGALLRGTLGLFASHAAFQGGDGGTTAASPSDPAHQCVTGEGGAGGHGLRCDFGATASAQLVGGVYVGGAGGIPIDGRTGTPGTGTVGANITTFQGPPRVLLAPAVVRENTSSSLTFFGQPGDEVYLRMARQTGYRDMPAWKGVLLTRNPHPEYVAIIGTIPDSGVLDTTITTPDLGAGVGAQSLFLQAQFKNTQGSIWLGSFAALTQLDSAF